ncbi:hypothetical protein LQK89_02785 [Curtobacterium sp. C1]|uniref:gp53-like domain-containing protein n=1 Tax=Curtobacterium sp. C1 TaxID=2898151 RepID=UPI001E5A8683|nr:hypothetical protein [Curtobacterium sp. C1]UFU14645.1 hypothetical protein LQK89_02785 [Curtobacterium sp. C1]
MSVILGPGRAKITGTSVAPLSSGSNPIPATTQGMYDVLNDANVTLTVAAANATNPRIDAVYVGVQDSFYSGSTNQAIPGIVTGVAAATPVAPAVPSNAVLIAYIAVAANASSIGQSNISDARTFAFLRTSNPGNSLLSFPSTQMPSSYAPIIQVGYVAGKTSAGGVLYGTFPQAFPNFCGPVFIQLGNNSNGSGYPTLIEASSTTTGFGTFWPSTGSTNVHFWYLAIGG